MKEGREEGKEKKRLDEGRKGKIMEMKKGKAIQGRTFHR